MTEILQKVSRSENSICQKCFHYRVCRAIDNQPCFECNQFAETEKWIPVTERLPEENVRVLVWLGTGDITYTQIDTDRLHKKKWRRWTKNVTHWMPLPEPPKEDKQ